MVANLDPIDAAWHDAWAPPDRRINYQWASEHVNLQGDYAKTGRFSIGDSRYLIFPFECLANDFTRMVNVLKAPRTGGSLIGDVWLQDIFRNRPAPTMATFQSDPDGERHYLTKIKKTFEATEINAERFAQLKQKRDLYQFPHMNFYFQGANINSLQGKGVQNEWNDEVWIWKAGMLEQAFSRTEDYKRVCKILNISQGGAIESEWETVYNRGKRHNYGVRCFSCSKLQSFEFFADEHDHDSDKPRAGLVWDRSARRADKTWDITRAAETTRFRCVHCGHEHADDQRTYERFAASAAYVDLDPDRGRVDISIRWNALVGGDWWRLVKKFLQACESRDINGNTVALENFHKKELASFWNPLLAERKAVVITGDFHMEPVNEKGYKATPLEWEEHRFITADYQQGTGGDTRHLIVVCRAWSDETRRRSRLLWTGRVNTFAELYRIQLALAVRPACVGVDGSFEMMEVAAQCAKYGWTMLIGDDADYFLHKRKKAPPIRRPYSPPFRTDPLKGKTGQGKSSCVTIRWSNPAIKNLLWNQRHGLTLHKWETPADIPPDYRDGIDSEVKKFVAKKGSAVPVALWVKIKANNHPWDCECMQTVIAVAAGCLTFDVEEDAKKDPTPGAPDAKAPAPKDPLLPPHAQPEQLTLLPT